MLLVPIVIFLLTLALLLGGYFLFEYYGTGRAEIKERLSFLKGRTPGESDAPEVLKGNMLSEVTYLNLLLSKFQLSLRIDRRLRQAGMKINVGTFVLVCCTLFALGAVTGMLLHWPFVLAFIAGLVLLFVPLLVLNVKRRTRINNFISQFPDALEMFARSLRAGHSFTGAIQMVGQEMPDPIGPEFQKVFDEQNLGIPLRQALLGMADRIDALDVKFFVTAILIQRETGGNLAEIIDNLSYVIRERFRVQGQLKIYTAQGRMTGVVLVLLPIAIACVILMSNPDYLKPLLSDSIGRSMIAVAVVMQVAGAIVVKKIVRIKI
jgi:tight adherence protein B